MNKEFLNKVLYQILSETRINNDKIYTPFLDFLLSWPILPCSRSYFHNPSPSYSFSCHCKEVYSLKNDEVEYIWDKYKEEITTLIDDKELIHQEKG